MRGIRNKAGKVPPSSFQAGKLEHVGPSELLITPNGNDRMLTETGRDGNRVSLELVVSGGKPLTPRLASVLSRALLKCGLEFAWVEHGEEMLDAKYDALRTAVLGTPRSGVFTLDNRGEPNAEHVVTRYEFINAHDGTLQMAVFLDYLGSRMATLSTSLPAWPDASIDALRSMATVVAFEPSDYPAADRRRAAGE